MTVEREQLMEKIVALCKRRGFVYQSSEIYGGINALYDFGPYGVVLRRNIRNLWWRHVVELRDDVFGLESSVIMHPRVWEASGHVETFTDPLVECMSCHQRFRADHVDTAAPCTNCGKGPFTEPRQFNLMFQTHVGPVQDSASAVFLRPETAQGMFADFKNVVNSMRNPRLPFGIAQQGRAFRNEISPGNFIFRLREFELMEFEFFVKPGEDEKWHDYWRQERMKWYLEVLGVHAESLRFYDHPKESLSHYSKGTTDIEFNFPFGWGELEGVANRTDYDLRRHQEYSGEDLTYLDPDTSERYLPYVIEPAVGCDRIMAVLLLDAYDEDEVNGETRVVLRFHRNVAPVQVAVMPLSKKEPLIEIARDVQRRLRPLFRIEYDQTGGNIGRRYRRQDEIGTPFCVTVDFDTVDDRAVTIRERDSTAQERIAIDGLADRLRERFAGP